MRSERWVAMVSGTGRPDRSYAFRHPGSREEATVWFGLAHRCAEALTILTIDEWFSLGERRTKIILDLMGEAQS